MVGRILPFILCTALLAVGGCSRSYDGTVIIPRPLDVRRFWDRAPYDAQSAQPRIESTVFPVAPQAPHRSSARKGVNRITQPRRMPSLYTGPSSGPEKLLACRNVSEPGKRVRMVCE
jgi:hypothetical protein